MYPYKASAKPSFSPGVEEARRRLGAGGRGAAGRVELQTLGSLGFVGVGVEQVFRGCCLLQGVGGLHLLFCLRSRRVSVSEAGVLPGLMPGVSGFWIYFAMRLLRGSGFCHVQRGSHCQCGASSPAWPRALGCCMFAVVGREMRERSGGICDDSASFSTCSLEVASVGEPKRSRLRQRCQGT